MRSTSRRTTAVPHPRCPPDCWSCAVQDQRPPATPLGVAVVGALLTGLRRCGARAAAAGPARSWPFSAWWEESLGQPAPPRR